MPSRRPRTHFLPTMDYLDRRDVPTGLTFIDAGSLPCDLGNTAPPASTIDTGGSTTNTTWPSPLVISGP